MYTQERYKELNLEWDNDLNLNPLQQYSHGSHYRAYWICHICGYKWQASIKERYRGRNCPKCSLKFRSQKRATPNQEKSLLKLYPELSKEWDKEKNILMPENVFAHSRKVVWWKCEFGHSWKASVRSRTSKKGHGCPYCNNKGTSFPEQAIFFYLSQVTLANNRDTTWGKEIDIFLPDLKIGIEYNGSFYHQSQYKKELDAKKKDFFKNNQIQIIVVTDSTKNFVDEKEKIIYVKEYTLEWGIEALFKILNLPLPDINLNRDRLLIVSNYQYTQKSNSLALKVENSLSYWDYEKNTPLSPLQLSPYSITPVWWKCLRSHKWQATPSTRIIKNKNGELYLKECKLCEQQYRLYTLYNTKTHSLYHSMASASKGEKQSLYHIQKSLKEKDGEWIEVETNRFPTFISPFATELYYKDYYYKELYAEELNHV